MEFNSSNISSQQGETVITIELTERLKQQFRFIGIMQQLHAILVIIFGAIICLGIFTSMVGIPMIICGIKLFKSGSQLNLAANNKNGNFVVEAITNLHGYWKFKLIYGLLFIVFFVVLILSAVITVLI